MQIQLRNDHRELLFLFAAAAHPHESCGLLLGQGTTIEAIVPADNVATDPARSFEIDPKALFAVQRRARGGGLPILGYFHSHPSGDCTFSARDLAGVSRAGEIWLLVARTSLTACRTVVHGDGFRFESIGISIVA